MSDRPRSGRLPVEPEAESAPSPEAAVRGVLGEALATRSGEDTRRRGWFWHWNSVVTQYSPLIGLKGVGLLNSYTVWTDRREESPHRGYAFPSQQREAEFYGEDRAELITINKILVALDLIEIRKEMVLRVDEKGRRWRVPHNFYRVKDHADGSALTSGDVLRVIELADRDQGVYRYIRRIFSERFAPIDRDNIWVGILAEIEQHEVWRRLAARARREEARASDRTRAGHAARKAAFGMPNDGDSTAPGPSTNDSETVAQSIRPESSVASTNNGLESDVGGINRGSSSPPSSSVGAPNRARTTGVARTNTTYHQTDTTTKRTNSNDAFEILSGANDVSRPAAGTEPGDVTARDVVVTAPSIGQLSAGPGGRGGPADAPGALLALRSFEEANARAATPAERRILAELAERYEAAAIATGDTRRGSGWLWVASAVNEAVEAGSAYVAPRRIREILQRWERDGLPAGTNREATPAEPEAPDIPLPHGHGSRKTWAFVTGLLGAALDRRELDELIRGVAIGGYQDGVVTLLVPGKARADRIAGEYRELIERKLSEAMRRPVRLAVASETGPEPTPPDGGRRLAPISPRPVAAPPQLPVFTVAECGLPNAQVWLAVLDEVAAGARVGSASLESWLRQTVLLDRGSDGRLIVGVASGLAQRRIAGRYGAELRRSAAAVIGVDVPIDLVITDEWLQHIAGDRTVVEGETDQLAG